MFQNKLNVLEVELSESLSLALGATDSQAASQALLKLVLESFNSLEEVCELFRSANKCKWRNFLLNPWNT